MDRRTTLAAFLGRSKKTAGSAATAAAFQPKSGALPTVLSGLEPYTGNFEYEQAAHLLRRTTFGPNYTQIKEAVSMGLDATVKLLFEDKPAPAPPINHNFTDDPFVPIGETWIDAPYLADVNLRGYRNQSLRAWTMLNMINERTSVREKLVLFWHNHFVTAEINDPKFRYRNIELYREFAWGNFRELTKRVTIDPTMLRYLNGNQNTAASPNENYARELLELFTIGKGPAAGPGDYTNYTEDDVVQIARVLTGWRDVGFVTLNPDVEVSSVFIPNRHDKGEKTLSHRFDNVVISDMGADEYAHLIDIVFQKDEVARFICRKFYRWFVYYVITDEIEANVIEPMAQILIDNDYEIRPALEALFRSAHFYDMLNVGPMIKNPLDFIMSILKQPEVALPDDPLLAYRFGWQVFRTTPLLQMEYYNPPSVAGWKAYYQEPSFYRIWINSVTLPLRQELSNLMVFEGIAQGGFRMRIDTLKFAESLDNPFDPNELIREFAAILFPQPITESQVGFLKEILIPGLPDFEWTVEYGEYVADPTDPDKKMAVENKLKALIGAMMSMPEFYLS
ncbi:MAG: DUF1800 domain-containing protein [Bacteroidetes bacterium]|nr:MAG: DUF1800 domain-containing protein [Bacteroidota bacterium]